MSGLNYNITKLLNQNINNCLFSFITTRLYGNDDLYIGSEEQKTFLNEILKDIEDAQPFEKRKRCLMETFAQDLGAEIFPDHIRFEEPSRLTLRHPIFLLWLQYRKIRLYSRWTS